MNGEQVGDFVRSARARNGLGYAVSVAFTARKDDLWAFFEQFAFDWRHECSPPPPPPPPPPPGRPPKTTIRGAPFF